MSDRVCAWCGGPIPSTMRADAVCCSTSHRQARHRFTRGVGVGVSGANPRPLRLAYADPPYPGLSARYYSGHPDYAGEVDHAALIAQLVEFDGWALSTSEEALQMVLELCPPGVRIAAWTRGAREGAALGPRNAWEPVVYSGGRASVTPARRDASPVDERRVDTLVAGVAPRLTDPNRVTGAKPAAFCGWLFRDLLGARAGDEFVDLFPGSGGVSRAWRVYSGVS
jgi:hypothetical protein